MYLLNLEDKVILIMREKRDERGGRWRYRRKKTGTKRGKRKTKGGRRKPASQFHYQVLCNGGGGVVRWGWVRPG